MKSFLIAIKNILLWSHERGSWQYDVLCLLIVATIFLVPSRYFGDRDRLPAVQANGTGQIASKAAWTIQIEEGELQAYLRNRNKAELMNSPQEAIVLFLQDHLRRDVTEVNYKRFTNSEGRVVYDAWFK